MGNKAVLKSSIVRVRQLGDRGHSVLQTPALVYLYKLTHMHKVETWKTKQGEEESLMTLVDMYPVFQYE